MRLADEVAPHLLVDVARARRDDETARVADEFLAGFDDRWRRLLRGWRRRGLRDLLWLGGQRR